MKWCCLEPCTFGDIVRVKIGEIYHYGIYVTADDIIQFGHIPTYYLGEHKNDPVVVLTTDMHNFLNGGVLEKGIPNEAEKNEMFSPSQIVVNAQSRLGQGGYNFIHNNCEHFVYECAFGRKYSEQEEKMRLKWKNRPRLYLYVSFEDEILGSGVMPELRRQEIMQIKNSELKKDKINAWKLLNVALANGFHIDPTHLEFTKNEYGKWETKDYFFSISHTHGAVVVAISNAPCGVDIENITSFRTRCANESFTKAFAKKIGESSLDYLELLKKWTGKESIYKVDGNKAFCPFNIQVDEKVKYFQIGDYMIAVAGIYSSKAVLYQLEKGELTPF